MKVHILLGLLFGSLVFAADNAPIQDKSLGMITIEDFAKIGVSKERVVKANEIIKKSKNTYEYLLLDRKGKELEINKCILEGIDNNWDKIDKLVDDIGDIEAKILKDRIKAQYEAQKCISQEEYLKARDIAIRRIESQKVVQTVIEEK